MTHDTGTTEPTTYPPTTEEYKGRTITTRRHGEHAMASCGHLKSKRFQGSSAARRATSHVRRLIDREGK